MFARLQTLASTRRPDDGCLCCGSCLACLELFYSGAAFEDDRTQRFVEPVVGLELADLKRILVGHAAVVNARVADRADQDLRIADLVSQAKNRFPDAGWEIRTRTNISPQFERNLDKFTQFLTLVGLTALIVGGVGVASAVRGYVDRKRSDIATMKSVGATGGFVFLVMLVQVLALAALGIFVGAAIGVAIAAKNWSEK